MSQINGRTKQSDMQETTGQYVERITGYVRGKNHLKVLQATVKKLTALVRGKRRSTLARRPSPEKWSVAEIVAHLAESEIVFAYRLRMVLSQNGVPIQSFDEQQWQQNAYALIKDPRLAMEVFSVVREANILLLRSLSRTQWEMHGTHSERGKETVARMVELYAGHDVNHLMQVRSVLRG
jgi:hypothetical protein